MSSKDLARGRALALYIMDGLDQELALIEALLGSPLVAARKLQGKWRTKEPGDLFCNDKVIEEFTAEISMARSSQYGGLFHPCPFDPYHENADAQAWWRPPGSVVRPVKCCFDDAHLIKGGDLPKVRIVPSLKGPVPLWEGSEIDARWLSGHHALSGAMYLGDVFRGTPIGRVLNRMQKQ
ncbi:hypothetical protein ACFWC5_43015 [Streptomyces sp. NPDC060085]|uniref:hypothetical protein n=1 Tax=Streptomyces sp. NPDC060085 TaxID=3347054 RepID=UPI003663A53B